MARPTVAHFDGQRWLEQDQSAWGPLFVAGPGDVWAGRFHLADGRWKEHPGTPDRILWGSGAHDLWAVDGTRRPDLLHWNGGGWAARVRLRGEIVMIGETSPDDAWGIGLVEDVWAVVRWDGRTWSTLPESTVQPWGTPPHGFAFGEGTSASDLWIPAIGGYAHWDGARWTQHPAPEPPPDSELLNRHRRPMTGTGEADVWAWNGALAHWDGTVWTSVEPPPGQVVDLWSPREGILFALGYRTGPWTGRLGGTGRDAQDVIWRRDASGWTEVLAGTSRFVTYDDSTFGLGAMWGPHPDDGWAVLSSAYRWDGASWTASGPLGAVTCLWGSGPGDLWARGNSGLWHFDGASWTRSGTGEPSCGAGSWAVADGGKLFRRAR